MEEMTQSTKLNKMVDKFCTMRASPDQLEEIDRQISFVLDAARRHTEGPKRTTPFSIAKAEARAIFLNWSCKESF